MAGWFGKRIWDKVNVKIILRGPKTNLLLDDLALGSSVWNLNQLLTTVLVSELHIDIFKIWRESCDIILKFISLSRRKVSATYSSYYFQTLCHNFWNFKVILIAYLKKRESYLKIVKHNFTWNLYGKN